MKTNVFICHRPYHILRCCDMINKDYKANYNNILFTFDVKQEKCNDFQCFNTCEIFYTFYNDVIELHRATPPSVRSFIQLYKYCKEKRKEYLPFVKKYQDIVNLFFFADDELEIQLLAGLFREYGSQGMRCILVDEGLVTYSPTRHTPSWKRILWLKFFSWVARIKYFNYQMTYGFSNLYNLSMANIPERAIYFHGTVEELSPLSENTCTEIRKKISSKHVPDYSQPYFIYVGTYEKPFRDEVPVITQLIDILKEYGVQFYIKLHPQQNEELYRQQFGEDILLEKGIPIELFFGGKVILGGTISSSLFNASLQGYCAMDICRLFPEGVRKKWTNKSITEKYNWINIHAIQSYAHFESIIKQVVSSLS